MTSELQHYVYRGARAMILIHDRYQREFLAIWRRAKAVNLHLPKTEDPDYESLDHLLYHLFRSSRGYMMWMCEKLGLPDPGIEPPPPLERIEEDADRYLDHLLERWRLPLARVSEERMSRPAYTSRWDMEYSIDSMLEHALVHPQRHIYQLEELLGER